MDKRNRTASGVIRRLYQFESLPPWVSEWVVDLWKLRRSGTEIDLEQETAALAALDHPEFSILSERESDLPSQFLVGETNPRVHILLHQIVETQLLRSEPPEVRKALAHLISLGVDRHVGIHLVLEGLVDEIHSGLKEKREFHSLRYLAHLERLSRSRLGEAQVGPKPGRNDPCPCGSGKKYKRCCGEVPSAPSIDPRRGKMLLGSGHFATGRYLEELPADHPLIDLENMAAVAEALEMEGAVNAAAEAWRRVVAAAEEVGEVAVQSALREQSEFAINNPEYATEGIHALTRLLGPGQILDDAPSLRLDLADLYDAAGEPDRAQALYEEVLDSDPADPWAHLRCARWLAEHGRRAEAEAAYRRLINRKGLGDRAALLDAKRGLGELS